MNKNRFVILLLKMGNINLEKISEFLKNKKFEVINKEKKLIVTKYGSPNFYIKYSEIKTQINISKELPEEKKKERIIKLYEAKIEVLFDDLEEVLHEINSLIELQGYLSEEYRGAIYRYWNNKFQDENYLNEI